jgi:predicted PurR-regulated permease PerM
MSTLPLKEAPEPPVAYEAPVPPPRRLTWIQGVAYGVIGVLLIFVLFRHLVSGFVAGLALYLMLDGLSSFFARHLPQRSARPLALILVTLLGGGAIGGGVTLLVSFGRHHAGRIPALMTRMADVLQSTRAWLGDFGQDLIPEVIGDADTLRIAMIGWLKLHAEGIRGFGGSFSMALVHILMGILLAVLVFFRHVRHSTAPKGELAQALVDQVDRFTHAFGQIASAQIKISAVNTALTAIYLLGVLPLFGRRLPFSTTIVMVTFICGLIPVLGNLISNTVIVILSMGISPGTAIGSLVFLVLIHKLEYLTNSRIVGGETNSQAWEILLAILLGETAFGVSGVVMAPIIYAYVKRELREWGLV